MKATFFLLPDIALFLVLCRMIAVRLHLERSAMFVFLSAYLLGAFVLLAWLQARPVAYPQIYFWATVLVWPLGAPAVWQATARLLGSPLKMLAVVALLVVAEQLTARAFALAGSDPKLIAMAVHAWAALLYGGVFLLASFGAEHPDLELWRGAGIFFLLAGGGPLLLRALGAPKSSAAFVILAGAAVWLLLAWFLGPTPDALINPEKIAVASDEWRMVSTAARKGGAA